MKSLIIIINLIFSILYGSLLTPENGSTLNHIHILFEWTQTPNAIAYDIQISSDPNYNETIFEFSDSSLGYIDRENIEWGNTYYWRVRPKFNTSNGPWTNSYSFSTGQSLSSSSVNITQDCCYANGITVFGAFFNYFSAAIDKTGKEIWNSGDENFVYYSTNKKGNVFGANLVPGSDNNLPGSEINFQGETIWQEPNDEFLHHDIIRLPNGNYLGIVESTSLGPIPIGGWTSSFQAFGFQANGITEEFPWVGDKIVEWDKNSKEIVWSWNVFDYFNMADFDRIGGTWNEALQSLHYDWTHVNAVIFDEEDSSIYISVRHLSRITKIAYPSGEIVWNLGHEMPSGDVDFGTDIGFSFQHSLQKLANGNILTLDNGNLSPEFRGTTQPITRAIEIEINNQNASINWSYELEPDLFGFASGNAQKLDNGNILITTVGGGGRSIEVDINGNIIWEGLYNLSLPDGAVYRAHRIPDLFPASFSVIINDLADYNGETGIYLPIGSSEISFNIVNEGKYNLNLLCNLSDDAGWFGNQELEIEVSPMSEYTINFSGFVTDLPNENPIHFIVTPIHHASENKTIDFNGFANNLNNKIEPLTHSFRLKSVYPNPFNPHLNIEYSLDQEEEMIIEVFNLNGQLQHTIMNNKQKTGDHIIRWNASDHPTGIYFLKLSSKSISETKKIIYLK